MNDFEDEPTTLLRQKEQGFNEAPQPQLLDDGFLRRSPDLGDGGSNLRLISEDAQDPRERPPLLRSAMKGGRRGFLADADERTRAIAVEQLREQGKDRAPKAKELKKARKAMVDDVLGGRDALKRAEVPQERRQFNRVKFAPNELQMQFDWTDTADEISAQKDSDREVWKNMRGGAAHSDLLFERSAPIRTEAEQQDMARKNAFNNSDRKKAVFGRNIHKLEGHLTGIQDSSAEEERQNAYVLDAHVGHPFNHSDVAYSKDVANLEGEFRRMGRGHLGPTLREKASILGSAETNNTDATVHAQAQGQTRAYSKGRIEFDKETREAKKDPTTGKPLLVGNERADVARYANNRGSGLSRFFSGIGDFFSKIIPGAQRLFGTSRDNRFEAAPGQREARQILRAEQDTFRQEARTGKLGLMRMLFGRQMGAGRARVPLGPRQEERPSTREEYALEQQALAEQSKSSVPAPVKPSAPIEEPVRPPGAQGSNDSLDGEEDKQSQMLELSSNEGILGNEDE